MTSQAPTSFEVPFVEKYRPVTLEDVVGNVVAIEQLKSIVQFGNMPNLILVVYRLVLNKNLILHSSGFLCLNYWNGLGITIS